jgi:cell division septal protein FtsQ
MSSIQKIEKLDSNEYSFTYVTDDGTVIYISADDLEIHLKKYFEIRKQLKKEKKLRKEYQSLDDAYKKYQAILALVKY